MNAKTGPLTKRHDSYPWEFQQTVGKPALQQLDIVYEEFQYLFNFNFGVLVHGIRMIFNKVMFLVTDH
jgi:hypothetical protein